MGKNDCVCPNIDIFNFNSFQINIFISANLTAHNKHYFVIFAYIYSAILVKCLLEIAKKKKRIFHVGTWMKN